MKTFLFSILFTVAIFQSAVWAQTWNTIPSGTTKNLNAISFPSSTVGYIAGNDSLLLKTTNGGLSWSPIAYTGIIFYPNGDDIIDINFTTENIGYLTVGPYSGTYKTTDGGTTWSAIDNIYMCFNSALYLFDENNGLLGGAGCFSGEIINRLSNGLWEETNVNPAYIVQDGMINHFDFWNNTFGIATGTANYFFRTTNGGITWDTIPNSLADSDTLTSVQFVDSSVVLATFTHTQSGGFGVLISQDAGLTWQPEMNSATFFYPNMFALEKSGNGHLYVGGENSLTSGGIDPGLIYHSSGGVTSWSYTSVAESIRDFAFYNDSVVFAIGEKGYILVNQNPAALQVGEEASLDQIKVYPNPSQGNVFVAFGEVQVLYLCLFDATGKVRYKMNPKEILVEPIVLPHLDNGVYQLQITTPSGNFVQKIVIQ